MRTANGALRAYVHACPDIGPGKIEEVLQTFKSKDYECIPFTVNEKPVIEVRGFKREAELLTLMDKSNFIDDAPQVTKLKEDNPSWGDLLSKRSLQLSGAAMMVADVGFAMYGAKGKRWEDTLAGLSYLTGSAVLTAYGRNDQSDLQIREGAQLILDHAKIKGLTVPEDTAISTVGAARHETPLRKVDNFFRAHPSEIGNMMYVVAGGLIAKAALHHRALAKPRPEMTPKQIHEMRKGGWGDTALGSVTIASGLTATMFKEKAKDPDATEGHKASPGGVVDWIRESPLRAASYGYIGSTLCHAYTTFIERKEAQRILKDSSASLKEVGHAKDHMKAIPWRVLFVSATLVGEALLSISSKGHGEGVVSDNTVDHSIVAVAAELIIKQPKHMQEDLIKEMGKYLGLPEVLALKDEEAIARLRRQVEEMRCNPWATKIPSASPDAQHLPGSKEAAMAAAKLTTPKGDMQAWQGKVAAADKAPTTNTLAL